MKVHQTDRIDGKRRRRQGLMAAGGLLGAVAASSCCIVPLVLFGLGVSGAWIGNLTRLAAYQPWIIAATLAVLSYGYWLAYRKAVVMRSAASCARPLSDRIVGTGLVVATLLAAAALGFDLVAPLFLDR